MIVVKLMKEIRPIFYTDDYSSLQKIEKEIRKEILKIKSSRMMEKEKVETILKKLRNLLEKYGMQVYGKYLIPKQYEDFSEFVIKLIAKAETLKEAMYAVLMSMPT